MGCCLSSQIFGECLEGAATTAIVDLALCPLLSDTAAADLSAAFSRLPQVPVAIRAPPWARPQAPLTGVGFKHLCDALVGSLREIDVTEASLPRGPEAVAGVLAWHGSVEEVSLRGSALPRVVLTELASRKPSGCCSVQRVSIAAAAEASVLEMVPVVFPRVRKLHVCDLPTPDGLLSSNDWTKEQASRVRQCWSSKFIAMARAGLYFPYLQELTTSFELSEAAIAAARLMYPNLESLSMNERCRGLSQRRPRTLESRDGGAPRGGGSTLHQDRSDSDSSWMERSKISGAHDHLRVSRSDPRFAARRNSLCSARPSAVGLPSFTVPATPGWVAAVGQNQTHSSSPSQYQNDSRCFGEHLTPKLPGRDSSTTRPGTDHHMDPSTSASPLAAAPSRAAPQSLRSLVGDSVCLTEPRKRAEPRRQDRREGPAAAALWKDLQPSRDGGEGQLHALSQDQRQRQGVQKGQRTAPSDGGLSSDVARVWKGSGRWENEETARHPKPGGVRTPMSSLCHDGSFLSFGESGGGAAGLPASCGVSQRQISSSRPLPGSLDALRNLSKSQGHGRSPHQTEVRACAPTSSSSASRRGSAAVHCQRRRPQHDRRRE